MPQDDVMRRIAVEALGAAMQSLESPAAEALAEAVGRRAAAVGPPAELAEAARRLAGGPEGLPAPVVEALARGLAAGAAGRAQALGPSGPAAGERPGPSWGALPRTVADLARTTRRAAHDLNQPLTVILGYAAILKRTENEVLRAEAAEHIVHEARKMNEIIAGLTRIARSLDAA